MKSTNTGAALGVECGHALGGSTAASARPRCVAGAAAFASRQPGSAQASAAPSSSTPAAPKPRARRARCRCGPRPTARRPAPPAPPATRPRRRCRSAGPSTQTSQTTVANIGKAISGLEVRHPGARAAAARGPAPARRWPPGRAAPCRGRARRTRPAPAPSASVKRQAERGAHERRGAGRGHGHRQHAGQRRVDQRVAQAHRRPARWAAAMPNSNSPARFSAISVNSTASAATNDRRLQLEAPADLLAAGAQRQQQRGQRHEGQHHAGGVGQAAGQQVRAGRARGRQSPAPSATGSGTRRASGSAACRRPARRPAPAPRPRVGAAGTAPRCRQRRLGGQGRGRGAARPATACDREAAPARRPPRRARPARPASAPGSRCAAVEIGTCACQVPPSQRAATRAAWSITPAVSGKKASVAAMPVRPAGRSTRDAQRLAPSTSSARACGTGHRLRQRGLRGGEHAPRAAAVAACAGTLSANSPCCGMHTSLHTSHCGTELHVERVAGKRRAARSPAPAAAACLRSRSSSAARSAAASASARRCRRPHCPPATASCSVVGRPESPGFFQ